MEQLIVADILDAGSHPLEAGIGAEAIETEKKAAVSDIPRQCHARCRGLEDVQEFGIKGCLLEQVQETGNRPPPSNLSLDRYQATGSGAGSNGVIEIRFLPRQRIRTLSLSGNSAFRCRSSRSSSALTASVKTPGILR